MAFRANSFKFLWKTENSKPPTMPFRIVACTFPDNLSRNSCMFFCILGYSPHVIRISESGKFGIRNPTNEWNQESKFPWQRFGIQYLEFKAWNTESKTVLDYLFLGRGIWFQSPLWASRHLFLWSLRTLNSLALRLAGGVFVLLKFTVLTFIFLSLKTFKSEMQKCNFLSRWY